MKKSIGFIWAICCFVLQLQAQVPDSSHTLPEIKVTALSALGDRSIRTRENDSSLCAWRLAGDITKLLPAQSNVYLRDYGSGTLSTISLNGTGPAHTLVYWNGVPLNNPMHGLADLSLQPAFLSDRLTLVEGGSGALSGSGAIGGALYVEADAGSKAPEGMSLFFSGDNLGGQQTGLAVRLHNGNLYTHTRIYNHFSYQDFQVKSSNGTTHRQRNALRELFGFSEEMRWGRSNGYYALHALYLDAYREIPPLMTQELSVKKQTDKNLRLALSRTLLTGKMKQQLLLAVLFDDLIYVDSLSKIADTSKSRTVHIQYEWSLPLRQRSLINFAMKQQWNRAQVPAYDQLRVNSTGDVILGYRYSRPNLECNFIWKETFTGAEHVASLPEAGIYYAWNKNISFRSHAAGVYRLPTLNDLYWQPGGNSDLAAEHGYAFSGSCDLQRSFSALQVKGSIGVFHTRLDQAIVWSPNVQGLYEAGNIQELKHEGWQVDLSITHRTEQRVWKLGLQAKYNSSVILKSTQQLKEAIGKQMIYVPKYQGGITGSISQHNWEIRLDQQACGLRYTEADNSSWLEGFQVGDLSITKRLPVKRADFTLSFQVRNIWNAEYQLIAWHATPGRNFQVSVLIDLKK